MNWPDDINTFREKGEKTEEWDLRKRFIEYYRHHYSISRLLFLSTAYTNIQIYNGVYPERIMAEIKKLVAALKLDENSKTREASFTISDQSEVKEKIKINLKSSTFLKLTKDDAKTPTIDKNDEQVAVGNSLQPVVERVDREEHLNANVLYRTPVARIEVDAGTDTAAIQHTLEGNATRPHHHLAKSSDTRSQHHLAKGSDVNAYANPADACFNDSPRRHYDESPSNSYRDDAHHSPPHHPAPYHSPPHHSALHHSPPHHSAPHHSGSRHSALHHSSSHHSVPHHSGSSHHSGSHHSTPPHHSAPRQHSPPEYRRPYHPVPSTSAHNPQTRSAPLLADPSHFHKPNKEYPQSIFDVEISRNTSDSMNFLLDNPARKQDKRFVADMNGAYGDNIRNVHGSDAKGKYSRYPSNSYNREFDESRKLDNRFVDKDNSYQDNRSDFKRHCTDNKSMRNDYLLDDKPSRFDRCDETRSYSGNKYDKQKQNSNLAEKHPFQDDRFAENRSFLADGYEQKRDHSIESFKNNRSFSSNRSEEMRSFQVDKFEDKRSLGNRFEEKRCFPDDRFAEKQSFPDDRFREKRHFPENRFEENRPFTDDTFDSKRSFIDGRFTNKRPFIDDRFEEKRSFPDDRFAEKKLFADNRFEKKQFFPDNRLVENQSYHDERFEKKRSFPDDRLGENHSFKDDRFEDKRQFSADRFEEKRSMPLSRFEDNNSFKDNKFNDRQSLHSNRFDERRRFPDDKFKEQRNSHDDRYLNNRNFKNDKFNDKRCISENKIADDYPNNHINENRSRDIKNYPIDKLNDCKKFQNNAEFERNRVDHNRNQRYEDRRDFSHDRFEGERKSRFSRFDEEKRGNDLNGPNERNRYNDNRQFHKINEKDSNVDGNPSQYHNKFNENQDRNMNIPQSNSKLENVRENQFSDKKYQDNFGSRDTHRQTERIEENPPIPRDNVKGKFGPNSIRIKDDKECERIWKKENKETKKKLESSSKTYALNFVKATPNVVDLTSSGDENEEDQRKDTKTIPEDKKTIEDKSKLKPGAQKIIEHLKVCVSRTTKKRRQRMTLPQLLTQIQSVPIKIVNLRKENVWECRLMHMQHELACGEDSSQKRAKKNAYDILGLSVGLDKDNNLIKNKLTSKLASHIGPSGTYPLVSSDKPYDADFLLKFDGDELKRNNYISLVIKSAEYNHVKCTFDLKRRYGNQNGDHFCQLTIGDDGYRISAYGHDAHAAKYEASERAIENLQKIHATVVVYEEKERQVTREDVDAMGGNVPIAEDNVGRRMMQRLGWNDQCGLGTSGQGIVQPIEGSGVQSRSGLGGQTKDKVFEENIRKLLTEYLTSDGIDGLVFDNRFSKDERFIIHSISDNFKMRSRSSGFADVKRLQVHKKISKFDLLKILRTPNFVSHRYKLFEATNSIPQ